VLTGATGKTSIVTRGRPNFVFFFVLWGRKKAFYYFSAFYFSNARRAS